MSWTDYTRAKFFGSGIHLPFSEMLADVEMVLDNNLVSEPKLAKQYVPVHQRDVLFVHGEHVVLIAISRERRLQHPTFQLLKWAEFWTTSEDNFPSPHDTALELKAAPLLDHLTGQRQFIDPIVIALPAIFSVPHHSEEWSRRTSAVQAGGRILFERARVRYLEKQDMDRPKDIFLSHKSVDKAVVRTIAATLAAAGYTPWLTKTG